MSQMNRYFAAISLVLFVNSYTFSQEKGDHELTFGYGVYSLNKMTSDVAGGFSTLFTLGTTSFETTSSGVFNAAYKYAATGALKVGIVIAYEQLQVNHIYAFSSNESTTTNYLTTAFESDVRYIRKPAFQMYSGLGMGYTMISSKKSGGDNKMNFHVNLLGLRLGKEVALRLEFGLGYKGMLNGGLSIQI